MKIFDKIKKAVNLLQLKAQISKRAYFKSVKRNWGALEFVPKNKQSKKLCWCALKQSAFAIEHIHPENQNKKMAEYSSHRSLASIKHLRNDLITQSLIRKACRNISQTHPEEVAEFLLDNARKFHFDLSFVRIPETPFLKAVSRDWEVLRYVSRADQTDEIVEQAVKQSPEAYRCIHPELLRSRMNILPAGVPVDIVISCVSSIDNYDSKTAKCQDLVIPYVLSSLPDYYQKSIDVENIYGWSVKQGMDYFNVADGKSINVESFTNAMDFYHKHEEYIPHPLRCNDVPNNIITGYINIINKRILEQSLKEDERRTGTQFIKSDLLAKGHRKTAATQNQEESSLKKKPFHRL